MLTEGTERKHAQDKERGGGKRFWCVWTQRKETERVPEDFGTRETEMKKNG